MSILQGGPWSCVLRLVHNVAFFIATPDAYTIYNTQVTHSIRGESNIQVVNGHHAVRCRPAQFVMAWPCIPRSQ